ACRSTPRTVCTARRVTSRIPTRSSTGQHQKVARGRTTSRCRNFASMSEIWRPSTARVADANLTRFMEHLGARKGLQLRDYDQLYAWSVAQPEDFWTELARFAGVRIDWGTGPAIADDAGRASSQMPGARFFRDSRLNFAENLLRYADDEPALVFRNER